MIIKFLPVKHNSNSVVAKELTPTEVCLLKHEQQKITNVIPTLLLRLPRLARSTGLAIITTNRNNPAFQNPC